MRQEELEHRRGCFSKGVKTSFSVFPFLPLLLLLSLSALSCLLYLAPFFIPLLLFRHSTGPAPAAKATLVHLGRMRTLDGRMNSPQSNHDESRRGWGSGGAGVMFASAACKDAAVNHLREH